MWVTRRHTNIWSLPGGKVDPGETAIECVVRETKEETGFDLDPQYVIPMYSEVVPGDDGNDFYCTAYWYMETYTGNALFPWSIEPGIVVKFMTVPELLEGAFSDFNKNALMSLKRIVAYAQTHERHFGVEL